MILRDLSVLLLLMIVLPVAGLGQDGGPLCDQHPEIQRRLVEQAKSEERGLQAIHVETVRNRASGGIAVQLNPGSGGGDCPDNKTARGRVAEAVGALLYGGQLHCSAVLVAPSTILTAAHCVMGFDLAKMEFVVGEDATKPIQRASILDGDRLPRYDPKHFGVGDIAYLHLKRTITAVEPISYLRAPLKSLPTRILLHVGYGVAGEMPGRRRCVDIPVDATCDHAFSNQVVGLNTCNGDSGGGVFYNDGSDIRLIGITSWGDELCQKYGVSLDIGSFQEWVGSWIGSAERNLPPARIEPSARKYANPSSAAAIRELLKASRSWERSSRFKVLFEGKWVRWEGRMNGLPEATRLGYRDYCDAFLDGQGMHFLLLGLEQGCDLRENARVSFEGQLLSYQDDSFDIANPELTRQIPGNEIVGEFTLQSLDATKRRITERRNQGFRLESGHGEWSGRVDRCQEVNVEAPWRLDRSQPISVDVAYQNHGGFGGRPEGTATESKFCIPLWAEGFGGLRTLGVQIDAGNVGVISGSVTFTVFREEDVPGSELVRSGTLSVGTPIQITLPDKSKEYELHLRMSDGREIVTRQALSQNGVKIEWDRAAGEIRITPEGK
jgi:hypothetical protein